MVELLRADEVVAGDAERGEFAAQVRRGGTLVARLRRLRTDGLTEQVFGFG